MNYPTLIDVVEHLPYAGLGQERDDFTLPLGDFILGLKGLGAVFAWGRELTVSPQAMTHLMRDQLRLPVELRTDPDLSENTKLLILYDKAINRYRDTLVTVRSNKGRIVALTEPQGVLGSNPTIGQTLLSFQEQGKLPEETYCMAHSVSKDGRNMHLRLVSPVWDFELPERTGQQPFHGNLVVSNNELVGGSFQAMVAVTRTSCLNSTIGRSIYEPKGDDLVAPLGDAVADLARFTYEMRDEMYEMQIINIANPLAIFDKLAKELGLPQYAQFAAQTYWHSEGRHTSLYDIIQAVAAGERELTIRSGRRRENWSARTLLERKTWGVVSELRRATHDGSLPEDWYLEGDDRLKYRIMRVIESYQDKSPVVGEILDEVKKL